jgi:hypothetical protein
MAHPWLEFDGIRLTPGLTDRNLHHTFGDRKPRRFGHHRLDVATIERFPNSPSRKTKLGQKRGQTLFLTDPTFILDAFGESSKTNIFGKGIFGLK